MAASTEIWHLDGKKIEVTHLEKYYWPEEKITKRRLLAYYRDMAPVMLPYFNNRPVTLQFFPDGIHGFSYYRRELPEDAPSWIRSVEYTTEIDPHIIKLPLIDDAAGLVWFANKGAIEFHLWASRANHLVQPDWAIFDHDPGDKVPFDAVLEVALYLRDALHAKGLEGYPKTSGGQGLHVYVPLAPGYTYQTVREWVKNVGKELATAHPQLIALPHRGTHKGTHVTVDYMQNSMGHNTAAPYTVRAHPGGLVSMPVSWGEIEEGKFSPQDFSLFNAPKRAAQHHDLFTPVLQQKFHLK